MHAALFVFGVKFLESFSDKGAAETLVTSAVKKVPPHKIISTH